MVPSYYEFYNPVRIISGFKALENLPYELEQLGVKRPLIVTDKGVLAAGLLRPVLTGFIGSGIRIGGIFNDVPQDSEKRVVNTVASVFWRKQCDCFVALGGGSVIDTAKGANIVVSERADDLMAFAGADILQKPLKPLIVIPTTSGTGSEVTVAAVISDTRRGVKMAFTSRHLLPRLAVLDPRMTRTLPPKMTAATGMDALTHAVEAYVSTIATPVTDACALKAIELVAKNLRAAVANGGDMRARDNMCYAQYLAGMAFNNASLGHVHAMAHQLGGFYDLPHGICNAILLPHVERFNMIAKVDRFVDIARAMGEVVDGLSARAAAEKALEAIQQLSRDVGIPSGLKELGVKKEDLKIMAQNAQKDACGLTNPRCPNLDDVIGIYENAM